jgi:hypothetical protein
MLDTAGTVVLVGIWPVVAGLIVFAIPVTARSRMVLATLLLAWFAWTAVAPRFGTLGGIVLPVLLATVLLVTQASARATLAGVFLPALIAVHVSRLAGGFFLLLHEDGRLANPFALIAGWGDIVSAILAIPAAIIAYRAAAGWKKWVLVWNVIGFVDFIIAVFLGATSQPDTLIRLFYDAPGTALLGDLPWRFIPAYYVPLFLILHIAIFVRLLSRPAPGDRVD